MRTTVTLDDDTRELLRRRMAQTGVSFKRALNDAVRQGLDDVGDTEPYRLPTFSMGVPLVDLTKANQLAAELEDQEIIRAMNLDPVNLVDTNVLLHATNVDAGEHGVARPWLERMLGGGGGIGFAWLSITGFLRISTRPGVFAQPLSVDQASTYVESWLGQRGAALVGPTPRHLQVLTGLLREVGTAGNLVSDAHLAALAIEHRAVVISFDRDFDRFPGVRWRFPS